MPWLLIPLIAPPAKRDWPQRWPEFLPNIMQLASADASCLLGLAVLRAVLDEFPATKEDLVRASLLVGITCACVCVCVCVCVS